MTKLAGALILTAILSSFIFTDINGYITLFENSSSAKYFKSGNSHYLEYFADEKAVLNGQVYYVNCRKYSWGKTDTSYYRKGADYYYHINKETLEESIALPVNPKLGDRWMESDKSWSYEVIAVDQKFKTKAKKYKDCIKVKCKQLTGRDKNKNSEYILFYSPKFGYVGDLDSKGKVSSYLSEVRINAKEGTQIGG